MSPLEELSLGEKYTKRQLAELLEEDGLITVREGVYSCKTSDSYFLFIDLEKEGPTGVLIKDDTINSTALFISPNMLFQIGFEFF